MHTSIYLVRHGQTITNRARRYQSWSDSPLTSYGQRQVEAVARRLRRIPFTVLVTSPVERTRTILRYIAEQRPAATQLEDAGWAETHHGCWEGLTYQEVITRFPEQARERFAAGAHGKALGGESLIEVSTRVQTVWRKLVDRFPGERILVATHATPIQLILCRLFDLAPDQHWHWRIDLGSVTCIDIYNGGTIVRMVNEVPVLGFKASES